MPKKVVRWTNRSGIWCFFIAVISVTAKDVVPNASSTGAKRQRLQLSQGDLLQPPRSVPAFRTQSVDFTHENRSQIESDHRHGVQNRHDPPRGELVEQRESLLRLVRRRPQRERLLIAQSARVISIPTRKKKTMR